jgi:transposase InsO family protein
MTEISKTMGVSRSHQYDKMKKGTQGRRRFYRKPEDEKFLSMIRRVIAVRITYGYRRVTAIINRELEQTGLPVVNPKRIYRLMKMHGLLLQKGTARPVKSHDGKVITNRSNHRWCSDIFEISCWSKEKVRVAFSLDCCDREIISYVATTGGIDGNLVRDLMLETVATRFGNVLQLPHSVEWLSDNGPAYISDDTRLFAEAIGLRVCTTPFYSPESNGMAESFVKTFKRDYVHANPLYDAQFVLEQMPKWFEDYNEHHPHKGLKMMSPRQFKRRTVKLELCPVI